ncbi:MAG: CD225/dispanin family protein [Bacteroidales bacterium]
MGYFILKNNRKEGPYKLEELSDMIITRDTMIWDVGFSDWKKASEVPELIDILATLPPPSPKMPKTWLVESILVTCCCCLPFGLVGIINSSKVESSYSQGDYKNAEYYSSQAKKWTLIGFFTTLILSILYVLIVGAIAMIPLFLN